MWEEIKASVSLPLQERFKVKNPPSAYLEKLKAHQVNGGIGWMVKPRNNRYELLLFFCSRTKTHFSDDYYLFFWTLLTLQFKSFQKYLNSVYVGIWTKTSYLLEMCFVSSKDVLKNPHPSWGSWRFPWEPTTSGKSNGSYCPLNPDGNRHDGQMCGAVAPVVKM